MEETTGSQEKSAGYISLHIILRGKVQGVNFRAFVEYHAIRLGLTGFVRNLPEGRAVEVQVEGERKHLEELLSYLHIGPTGARVDRVEINWRRPTREFFSFEILY